MAPPVTAPLAQGVHTVEVAGTVLRYHVHGTGPVCVAHPGGPGIAWDYLRAPALEHHLTMVYVEPLGTGGSGRLAGHPHGYTRALYSRCLSAVIDRLAVPHVHLLGHSHGGFVAQYHALHRPDQVAGIVLYDSAPVTGAEHAAEVMCSVEEFAARHAGHPELPAVLETFASIPAIADDEAMMTAARGVLPAYVAGYWGDPRRWAPLRESLRASYISGLDEHGTPDLVDDRDLLGTLTVSALVVAGRHDVVCGVRWAEELHRLIPASQLLVLEHSGHFGHLEEPERFAAEVAAFVTAGHGSAV
ncbi:alpha/beta fold hydrolase [Streptomyces sp. NPDC001222]|uniref:alpha/beta fold hydrolase n=1 Tax=Streptomyces sp. NPDC001222 TaxID=3364548 RepID=UPI0036C7A00C